MARTYWQRVSAYLKDNPKGYWFKRKLFGWGWIPAKWQGWAILGIFILYLYYIGQELVHSQEAGLSLFYYKLLGSIALLIWICYRTGEKPAWQWGLPKKYS